MTKRFAAALAAGLLCAAACFAEEDAGFQVTALQGDVFALLDGSEDWVALEEGAPLEPGDRVRVARGGRLELVNADGDAVEVQEESELELAAAAPKASSLSLWLGALLAKVAPAPDKKFEVRTPLASVAVRGTEFAVDVQAEGDSEVGVTEGAVAFQEIDEEGREQGETVAVGVQQGAGLRRGQRARFFRQLPPAAKRRLARMSVLRRRAPGLRQRWRRLPPERRRDIRQKIHEKWRALTPEQKSGLRRRMGSRLRDRRVYRREQRRRDR